MGSFRLFTIVGLSAILFLYACYIGVKNVFRYNMLIQEHAKLTQQLTNEKKKYYMLQSELTLQNNDAYWTYLAKKKLGYVNSNEVVYYVRTR